MSAILRDAIAFATQAHAGQVDKGGAPYIGHVLRVVDACVTEDEKLVAALHDVVEDTSITLGFLAYELGLPLRIVDAIGAITKRPGEPRAYYLRRVKANPLVTAVKLADMADNMRLERIPRPGPEDYKRAAGYYEATQYLLRDENKRFLLPPLWSLA